MPSTRYRNRVQDLTITGNEALEASSLNPVMQLAHIDGLTVHRQHAAADWRRDADERDRLHRRRDEPQPVKVT